MPRWLRCFFEGEPRRLAVRWGLLLGLALGGIVGYPHAYAYYHAWRAERLLENQDCAQALPHLKKCLNVWPASAEHHFAAARCSWREGALDDAEFHLQEAARLGWASKELDVEGLLIQAQRDFNRALESSLTELYTFAKDSQDGPLASAILEALVLALLRAERLEEAAELAQLLADRHPDHWRVHALHGRANAVIDTDAAAKAYHRSLELKLDQPNVQLWLGTYYARYGQPQAALQFLQIYQRGRPEDVEANLGLARAHHQLGQWPDARAALERVLAQTGDKNARALALRGLLELEEHGPDQAAPWLAKAEALAPFHPDIIDALTAAALRQADQAQVDRCHARKKQFEKHFDELRAHQKKMSELARQRPPNPAEVQETAYQLGMALFHVGDDDGAVKWMDSLLRTAPHHARAHQALAEYYWRVGETDKAQRHTARAGDESK